MSFTFSVDELRERLADRLDRSLHVRLHDREELAFGLGGHAREQILGGDRGRVLVRGGAFCFSSAMRWSTICLRLALVLRHEELVAGLRNRPRDR